MNVIGKNLESQFDAARKLYERGDFDAVLQTLSHGSNQNDPRALALMANSNLKLGRHEAGADLFAHLAKLVAGNRAFFLKAAAGLYLQAQSFDKLAAIGPGAIAANPDDSQLAFSVLKTIGRILPVEAIEPLLTHLNGSDPEQVYFAASFHRDRTKKLGESYRILQRGIVACPGDGFLLIQQYSLARLVSDFPVMRAFDAMMKPPRSALAEQIFVNQTSLDRLYWSDDEQMQSAPTHSSAVLERRRKAEHRQTRPRRKMGDATSPLRIGYISSDFGNEVVMSVFRPVIERHDPVAVDIKLFCYSPPPIRKFQENWPAELRSKIISIADMSDEHAAQIISTHDIDVLVDLKGHTKGDRLNIMGLTDAPLTVTYLGYPGSVDGAGIDYLIADPVVTPDTSRPFYGEKICRLPDVQMPNNVLSDEIANTSRSDWNLPDDKFVFASFNGLQKITPRTLDLWVRILTTVADSVLWIACRDDLAAENLLAEFARQGIDASRIVFNSKSAHFAEHIARIGLADLALDTLPYNGHATNADMLRGSLPVVTVRGKSYHSRVGWSVLKSCGIEELAVDSDEDYCATAIALANDPARLSGIRERLRENRVTSLLFDPERMARHLELAYRMMADRARQGLEPDHFDVPALLV
jgi:predicted O-linked N-acetylglucosamine transferase (SPINDLY family)